MSLVAPKAEKKKGKIKGAALFVLIAAMGFLVDLYCQRSVWMLPEEEQGVCKLDWEESILEGFAQETPDPDGYQEDNSGQNQTAYRLTAEKGVVRFYPGDRYIDQMELSYLSDEMVHATWYIWGPDGTEPVLQIEDSNSVLISSTVVKIGTVVNRIQVDLEIDTSADSGRTEDTGTNFDPADTEAADANGTEPAADKTADSYLVLLEASILNQYGINWFRILFVWAVLGLAAFLWFKRRWIASHMAAGYLAAALTLGTLMIVLLPANKAGWDEEVHFFHAYCVSHFGAEVKTNDIMERLFVADKENWPFSLPANLRERRQMNETLNTLADAQEYRFSRGHALAGIYTLAYIPQAIGLRLGFLLGLPFTVTYQLGRWFGLLAFSLLFAWAIHRIPVGKSVLAMLGLLPTPLFLMSVYSYDPFITALFALGFACFLDEYKNWQRRITWPGFLLTAGCFAIGAAPKALYVPLILVILLLPREKFKDRRQEYLMKTMAVAAFLALMATFVLPEILSPDEVGDTRGGNTSDASQIAYIFSDIPGFLTLMFSSVLATLPGFLFGTEVFGGFAHLQVGMLETAIPMLVFLVLLCEEKHLSCKQGRLSWQARTVVLVLCAAVIGMVWLAMYLAFTPVGADEINGVQARYYLPLLLPVYLCICPEKLRIPMKSETLYVLTIAGSSMITLTAMGMSMMKLCV